MTADHEAAQTRPGHGHPGILSGTGERHGSVETEAPVEIDQIVAVAEVTGRQATRSPAICWPTVGGCVPSPGSRTLSPRAGSPRLHDEVPGTPSPEPHNGRHRHHSPSQQLATAPAAGSRPMLRPPGSAAIDLNRRYDATLRRSCRPCWTRALSMSDQVVPTLVSQRRRWAPSGSRAMGSRYVRRSSATQPNQATSAPEPTARRAASSREGRSVVPKSPTRRRRLAVTPSHPTAVQVPSTRALPAAPVHALSWQLRADSGMLTGGG